MYVSSIYVQMGYSVNLYLDKAISGKQQTIINQIGKEEKNRLAENIENTLLQIFLYLRFNGKTIKVYADRKCTQKQWNFDKQRVDSRYYKAGAPELNKYLGSLVDEVCKLYEANLEKGKPTTSDDIKAIVERLNDKGASSKNQVTVEKAFNQYLDLSKDRRAANTIKKYNSTWNHLQGYAKYKRQKLSFDIFDLDFEHSFRNYLITEKEASDNTIAKYLKTLKSFLRFCLERGYHNNTTFQRYQSTEKEGEIYILSLEELMNLLQYEFNNDRLSQVRDVFCFMCFTGLRYSDAAQLRREHIKNNIINLVAQKTLTDTIIPLNPFALSILQRYQDDPKPLPIISNQKMNDYLKEIGQIVGLNEQVRVKRWINSRLFESYVPKYEVLTCHVGRKTFTTLSLILGMSETEVKAFTNHKSDKDFRRYVRMALEHKQKTMNLTWSVDNISNKR